MANIYSNWSLWQADFQNPMSVVCSFFRPDDRIFQQWWDWPCRKVNVPEENNFGQQQERRDHNQQLYGEVARRDYFASRCRWAVGAATIRLSLAQVEHSEVPPYQTFSLRFHPMRTQFFKESRQVKTSSFVCVLCEGTKRSSASFNAGWIILYREYEPIYREDNIWKVGVVLEEFWGQKTINFPLLGINTTAFER